MYICLYICLYIYIYIDMYLIPNTTNFKRGFTDITYLRFLGETWYGSYKHFQKKAKRNK